MVGNPLIKKEVATAPFSDFSINDLRDKPDYDFVFILGWFH